MADDRISLRQLLSLLFAALLAPAIGVLPAQTAALAGEAEFWAAAGGSMARVLAGFLLALAAGLLCAALAFRFSPFAALLQPLLNMIKSTPVASFILLALVWIPSPGVPVFTSFLMVFPLVFGNVLSGMQNTDPRLLEMGRMFGFSSAAMLRHIILPSAAPYLIAACTAGLGLAWKAGVAAEVLCQPRLAIGTQVYRAKITLETPDLFAWTAVVIALSFLLEYALGLLFRRLGKGAKL